MHVSSMVDIGVHGKLAQGVIDICADAQVLRKFFVGVRSLL